MINVNSQIKIEVMSIPAHIKYLVLSVLCIVAAINITRTTLNILKSSQRLNYENQEVASLEEDRKELQDALAYKNTSDFVEKEARNELNMVKPGEDVFIAPEVLSKGAERLKQNFINNAEKTNLQMWLDLLF